MKFVKKKENMIPKKIHYCWFGRHPLTEKALCCIESWRKYCPDYEIIQWNEDNFDIDLNNYVREAYEAKKWAFVSDVARLYVLVKYGGIYMDTDVEVIRPLDKLLQYEAVSGFEGMNRVSTGLMASKAGQGLFVELLDDYKDRHFRIKQGFDLTTNVTRITMICKKYGLVLNNTRQIIDGFLLLPTDYLCPKNLDTGEIVLTSNTLCIHHFDGSWLPLEEKYQQFLKENLRRAVPNRIAGLLARGISTIKYRGIIQCIYETIRWIKRVHS